MIALLRTLLATQSFAAHASRLGEEARRTVSRFIAQLIVAVLAIVAIGFFTAAGYLKLTHIYGPIIALLIIGGVYLGLSILVWIVSIFASRPRKATPRSMMTGEQDVAAAAQNALHNVGEALQQIKPEELLTKGGQIVVRTVGPLPLAGIAVLAGYILARRLDRK